MPIILLREQILRDPHNPLLFDRLFASMAVTIMFGLAFATVLTLVLVPVLYSIFFRVPIPVPAKAASKHRK